jgi:aryl-alcohol dehydrogenase-like predicted oxidoreductase
MEGARRCAGGARPRGDGSTATGRLRLRVIAKDHETSVARALAWLLHQPHVTSVIVGARRLEQLEDNLAACDVQLEARELHVLDEASRLPSEYPGWMHAVMSADRVALREKGAWKPRG